MIAPIQKPDRAQAHWQAGFLTLLPQIQAVAGYCFRYLDPEAREDSIQEVVANALAAYVRLVELGKTNVACPTALGRFGVAQVRAGRRVGNRLNVRDVTSRHCQRSKGVAVQSLDTADHSDEWKEAAVEDRRAGPAATAALRVDFAEWLRSLPPAKRRIAETLATSETTKRAAQLFRLTPGRISQLRRELQDSWNAFHGELALA